MLRQGSGGSGSGTGGINEDLFNAELPVIHLDSDTPLSSAHLHTSLPTSLIARLTFSSSTSELILTLLDLSNVPVLLRHTLTSTSYAALREAQHLRADFRSFPRELATLLGRPTFPAHGNGPAEPAAAVETEPFRAVLRAHANGNAGAVREGVSHTLSILQLCSFRVLSHVDLPLSPVPNSELLHTLAIRARVTKDLERRLAELTARVEDRDALAAQSDSLSARVRLAEENLQRERIEASERLRAQEGRLREEIESLRAANNVQREIMNRQETSVKTLQEDLQKLRAALDEERNSRNTVQRDLEDARKDLEEKQRKIEENATLLASDQQVIAYLNRELTQRDIAMHGGSLHAGNTQQQRRNSRTQNLMIALTSDATDGYRPSSSSSSTSAPTTSAR